MIPGEMMVITNYITVSTFGWVSTTSGSHFGAYASMIVPFWVSVFYIYLLRQNFKQIPNELYLAAKVDGKSDWNFLWKVLVPLSSPTLISIFILKLMGAWNSYVWPNLVVNDEKLYLITVALRSASFTTSGGATGDQGLLMAATVIVTVPLLLLFIFARKYIMKGVGRAGIKG
jgi:multiple sugar transport system permease protein